MYKKDKVKMSLHKLKHYTIDKVLKLPFMDLIRLMQGNNLDG